MFPVLWGEPYTGLSLTQVSSSSATDSKQTKQVSNLTWNLFSPADHEDQFLVCQVGEGHHHAGLCERLLQVLHEVDLWRLCLHDAGDELLRAHGWVVRVVWVGVWGERSLQMEVSLGPRPQPQPDQTSACVVARLEPTAAVSGTSIAAAFSPHACRVTKLNKRISTNLNPAFLGSWRSSIKKANSVLIYSTQPWRKVRHKTSLAKAQRTAGQWYDKTWVPTTLHHPHFVAFTQAAGLAAFTSILVDSALICGRADVVVVSWRKGKTCSGVYFHVVRRRINWWANVDWVDTLDAPLEKGLTALTGPHAVVVTRGVVVAHGAEVHVSFAHHRGAQGRVHAFLSLL